MEILFLVKVGKNVGSFCVLLTFTERASKLVSDDASLFRRVDCHHSKKVIFRVFERNKKIEK